MEYKLNPYRGLPSRCLCCGKPLLTYGRADRKYCGSACKNRYNNQHRPTPGQERLRIVRILDTNRELLHKLLKLGITSIDRVSMSHLGFNPEYVTSCHRMGTRMVYSCFDMSYEQTPTRIWRICQTVLDDEDAAEPGGRLSSSGKPESEPMQPSFPSSAGL